MKVPVQYTINFGKADDSDQAIWEIVLTQEEAAAYQAAVSRGDDPNDLPELRDALQRAADEIEAQEAAICSELGEENCLDNGCTITVHFADLN